MTIHYNDISAASHVRPSGLRLRGLRNVYRRHGKRLLDIVAVLMSAPIIAPLVLIAAAVIAASGGKPFYTQDRVGLGGRKFKLWKLRTMVPNADEVLAQYLEANEDARIEWDRNQKLGNDPRITPLGHFLRRSSMDELPQLINVLRGEMTLVGPRPIMTNQTAIYPGRSYYDMVPGLTGNWQVSERHNSTFADRAIYDNMYFHSISLIHDLKLIMATVGVVAKATGR